MNHEYNIRLITVDSCRYDTAVVAQTPFLDSVGPLKKAETPATYTYPAHHAFFVGSLPRIIKGGNEYLPGIDQLWWPSNARNTTRPIMFLFDGPNIISHYQSRRYNVQGFGGGGDFNTNNKNNALPALFDNFQYFGTVNNLHPHQRLPRAETSLPLGNIDLIAEKLDKPEPYFLFINCPETHIPYDVPDTLVDHEFISLVERVYVEHNSKLRYNPNNLPFTNAEIALLKAQQVSSLQWVDDRLRNLFGRLPKRHPTVTIVCGDHGEEFGDNGRFGHAHADKSVFFVPVWAGVED